MNGGVATVDRFRGAPQGNILDQLQQLAARVPGAPGATPPSPSVTPVAPPSPGLLASLLTSGGLDGGLSGAFRPPTLPTDPNIQVGPVNPDGGTSLGGVGPGSPGIAPALPTDPNIQVGPVSADGGTSEPAPAGVTAGAPSDNSGNLVGSYADAAPTTSGAPGALSQALSSPVTDASTSALTPTPTTATPAATSPQVQLAQLHDADPAKGFGTPYYGVYTDQGDLSATLAPAEGARVRLVDPQTGQVLAEGTGMQGAQQIATLANAVSQSLGKKAAYNITQERGAGTNDFQTFQAEDIDHPHANLLKSLVQIAGPLLGAAIPGLGPVLGAALGGGLSTAATGGDLKSSLLSALTSGLGNSLGGAVTHALGGSLGGAVPNPLGLPMNFAGTNALSGLLHAGSGLLSGLTLDPSIISGGSGVDSLAGLGTEGLDDLTGLGTSGLTGALSQVGGDLAGTIDPAIVTGGATPSISTAVGQAGADLAGTAGANALTGNAGTDQGDQTSTDGTDTPGSTLPSWLTDFAGQTLGGVGADLGVYGIAGLLGGGPGTDTSPTPDNGLDTSGIPPPDTIPALTITGDGGAGPGPGATPTPTQPNPALTIGGGSGTAPGIQAAAPALANTGGGGAGAGAPIAAQPDINTQGSTAPDIYPWQRGGRRSVWA